MSFAASAIAKW